MKGCDSMGKRTNKNDCMKISPAEVYSKDVVNATFEVMKVLETSEQRNVFLEYTKMIMLYIEQIARYYASTACSKC